MMTGDHVAYDEESYPNVFTLAAAPLDRDEWWLFECSHRRNDFPALFDTLTSGAWVRMYGFNSNGYDYPLLHHLCIEWQASGHTLTGPEIADAAYAETGRLIEDTSWDDRFKNHIWASEHLVEQCDLLQLHHFDNVNKMTSLKDLMFNLQCPDMSELPFKPGTILTDEEIETLIAYNINSDLWTTKRFAQESRGAIEFRERLIDKGDFGPECLSWNDVKIGEKFFIKGLEKAKPGITRKVNGRKPQTHRGAIRLADVIVPYVDFERPELREVLGKLRDTTVDGSNIKGAYSYVVPLEGVDVTIGAGGIHGARDRYVASSTTERLIIDIDVTGYYPRVAIVNRFFPAHIGEAFVDVYAEGADRREVVKHIPGMEAEAGGLKLSNNGAFGKTGDGHSVLLDAKAFLGITINGQLLQSMLAEALLRVPGLKLLQLNTDGLTVDVGRAHLDMFHEVCTWWQRHTCLQLEFAEFDFLALRDVNNYLARTVSGKVKRKGAYDYEMVSGSIGGQKAWNKDFSALVVAKAAEAAFLNDECPRDFIENHNVPYDFLIKKRVKGKDRLQDGHTDESFGKLLRYYIAKEGAALVKVMAPLAKSKSQAPRIMRIHGEGRATCSGKRKDYACDECGERFGMKAAFDAHNSKDHSWKIMPAMEWRGDLSGLDHAWYFAEAEKLLF
jgi:hypothetical protein